MPRIHMLLFALAVCGLSGQALAVTEAAYCVGDSHEPMFPNPAISPIPNMYTAKMFGLSSETLYWSALNFTTRTLECMPTIYTNISMVPPYIIGATLSERYPRNSRFGLSKVIAVIPIARPNLLEFYYYFEFEGPQNIRWEFVSSVELSTSVFEDWEGIYTDLTQPAAIGYIYVYTGSKVVQVTWDDRGIKKTAVLDLEDLSGHFLPTSMTRITAWGHVAGTLYIARAGDSISDPGQIMLFDEKTPGLRYLKSVYLEHAPNRLFTWKQAWGNALFWTTQNNATHSYLWFWDLSNHLGDVEPTRLDVGVGQCMELGPVVETQTLGRYAALTMVPCNIGPLTPGGYTILELYAVHGSRTIIRVIPQPTTKRLVAGLPLDIDYFGSVFRYGAFFVFEQDNFSLARRIFKFDQITMVDDESNEDVIAKSVFELERKNKEAALSSVKAKLPPFCSNSQCGPDSVIPNCPTSSQCVFYTAAATWACCAKSPFGYQ